MELDAEEVLDDGVVERRFTLDGVPGYLWMHPSSPDPAPLVLVGHPGGLPRLYPRVAGRARYHAARFGFAAATLELPGSGDRPPVPELEEARVALRAALQAGTPIDGIVDDLILPLVDRAVPEAQAAIDALLGVPGIGGPVGLEGGNISVGIRLASVDPRVAAANLFAGSFIPTSIVEDARGLTIPVQVLLQWDDEGNDRQAALDLFDAFGSSEKTLHANLGGHTGVPAHELEAGAMFLARHLR